MPRARVIIGILLSFPLLLILWTVAYIGIFSSLGYVVDMDSTELAEKIAQENGNAEHCFDLRYSLPNIGPSLGEAQAHCVYKVAELTKDATACELLMPSDYGFSCLGAVDGKLFLGNPCSYSQSQDILYCNPIYSMSELTINNPQIDDCSLYSHKDAREWCHYYRSTWQENVNECDLIENELVKDKCSYSVALKERDPSKCSALINMERRDFCTFRVNMTLTYR